MNANLEISRSIIRASDAVYTVKVVWRSVQCHVVMTCVMTSAKSYVTQSHQSSSLVARRPRIFHTRTEHKICRYPLTPSTVGQGYLNRGSRVYDWAPRACRFS